MITYPVVIHHLFTSAGHAYFGNSTSEPGPHAMTSHPSVFLEVGKGIPGDRFYNRKPDYSGQVTLFSMEVYHELLVHLKLTDRSPEFFRRNVLISGVPLNELIGLEFEINGIRLSGSGHCTPCRWMDDGFAPGAWTFLKGRGGLRCRILSSGYLSTGPANLISPVHLNLNQVTDPIEGPSLP
ncbi:MAG: molybdenum cofactor biosysynthesis protein [Bacteroidetes bacterium]|nr:molybdenum cofactor biosysynthesis protein [Bacteroidota bacterium]